MGIWKGCVAGSFAVLDVQRPVRCGAYRRFDRLVRTHAEDQARQRRHRASIPKAAEKVAGFQYVIEPLPMRNKMNAVVYDLFFASAKPVADKIVTDIFSNYHASKTTWRCSLVRTRL